VDIDRIDRAILMPLQKITVYLILSLQQKWGLSASACLKRVKRLQEGGVIISDVSIIDEQLAGNKMTLIVSIEME